MACMGLEIGRALRRARLARGMTRKGLATRSAGRFKPTSVAGYERGERSISLVRFCELCQTYGVPADRLLGEILRAVGAESGPTIDLAYLERLGPSERDLLSGFVQQVISLRRTEAAHRVALRVGDIEVLASASGRTAEELIRMIRPVSGPADRGGP
jgi:transcriptional regulator with XRE-family HTH domain